MEFESIAGHDPGAAVADVVQESIDATATRYTRLPDIDVEQTLADELRSRGVRATDDGALGEAAQAIRSGHRVDLGVHDDSVE